MWTRTPFRIAALTLLASAPLRLAGDQLIVAAQVDGLSRLSISPTEIYWDHIAHARPGTAGGSFGTYLDEYEWAPQWPNTPNGTAGLSIPLTNISVSFDTTGVALEKLAGRGPVRILSQPSVANGFRLHIELDDNAPSGPDEYIVVLHGATFSKLPSEPENFVVNGSFELQSLVSGHEHVAPANVPGWQTTEQTIEIWSDTRIDGTAVHGKQHIEILSDANVATVFQLVPTIPGEDYILTFYHSPRPGNDSTLSVTLDGTNILTIAENGSALAEFQWRVFRTNFAATASLTTIAFSDAASTAAGTHIDKVSVERLLPRVNIRVSEVELSWETVPSKRYQVQYHSALTTNAWTNLGLETQGTGGIFLHIDRVPVGEPQRFYRVFSQP